ncbi:Uncharacterised protein [Anaerotruncus sp. 2789STDY5834896]|uniref:Uncharacterized protein n=1 Tax=uncultured Anaerotruncus sp. TaxID=905011 RepID=A0A1C6KFB9_9FIRM|nr:Uncharacterised protein [uncultured Anaerotruncus sp.]
MIHTRVSVGKDVVDVLAGSLVLCILCIGYGKSVFGQIHISHIL